MFLRCSTSHHTMSALAFVGNFLQPEVSVWLAQPTEKRQKFNQPMQKGGYRFSIAWFTKKDPSELKHENWNYTHYHTHHGRQKPKHMPTYSMLFGNLAAILKYETSLVGNGGTKKFASEGHYVEEKKFSLGRRLLNIWGPWPSLPLHSWLVLPCLKEEFASSHSAAKVIVDHQGTCRSGMVGL